MKGRGRQVGTERLQEEAWEGVGGREQAGPAVHAVVRPPCTHLISPPIRLQCPLSPLPDHATPCSSVAWELGWGMPQHGFYCRSREMGLHSCDPEAWAPGVHSDKNCPQPKEHCVRASFTLNGGEDSTRGDACSWDRGHFKAAFLTSSSNWLSPSSEALSLILRKLS